jgi:hypothetical protein
MVNTQQNLNLNCDTLVYASDKYKYECRDVELY